MSKILKRTKLTAIQIQKTEALENRLSAKVALFEEVNANTGSAQQMGNAMISSITMDPGSVLPRIFSALPEI